MENENVKQKSTARKVIDIVVTVLVWVFVALSVVVTVYVFACTNNADGAPVIGGKCYLSVITDSMSPTFDPGDMIISDAVSGAERYELEVGDVISFVISDVNGDDKDDINSHRIVEVIKNDAGDVTGYRTQGDNEALTDFKIVSPIDVVCVWDGHSMIKGIGNVFTFLYTSTGFLCCVVIPLLLVFAYEIVYFVRSLNKIRNEGKKQITAEDEEEIKRLAVEEYLRQQAAAASGAAPASPTATAASASPAAPASSGEGSSGENKTE